MENSAEEIGNGADAGSVEIGKRKLRSVRRRLIQSTLLPHKPQEQEENRDEDEEKDCGEDEEFCGSQGKKKRKAKGKTTPQKRSSKKQSKEKQAANLTPKKCLHAEESPQSIPNLRLEAKMTAEENSRIFAGREIHPFFSSRKAGKKCVEATPLVERASFIERKNSGIDCNPIHVFEKTEDHEVFLDWRNWAFLDGTTLNNGHELQSTRSSVFEGSMKSLSLDDLPIVLQCFDSAIVANKESMDQGPFEEDCIKEATLKESSMLADKKLLLYRLLGSTKVEGNLDTSSGLTNSKANPNLENQSRFLQDRMESYYRGCQSHPKNCLWTYKYKPKTAMEVCGNLESVTFLSEWLHLWYERISQNNKDFARSDKSQKQVCNGNCSQSDSDYESLDEEDSLKNVLLVTGLSGSGKSAAIHACAEEHGFRVFEFSASSIRSGAVLKQMIGEALQSHQLNWAVVNSQESKNKFIEKSPLFLPESTAPKDLAKEVIELIPLSDEDSKDNVKGAGEFEYMVAETTRFRGEVKPLILLEDVDIIFLEDRGFISSIQEFAETGKGPIVLTSNSSNPVLPDNLDRLQISFIRPSSQELLSHLYMICASEGINIQAHLLERIIQCFYRDIRKIIMHLQFWCQGRGFRDKIQKKYGSLLFDLDAGHQILPMIMPWSFPSQLSKLVDEEISKSLLKMETSSCLLEVSEGEIYEEEMQNGKDCQNYEDSYLEAKKVAMWSRNGSVYDHNEFAVQFNAAHECSDTSGTPTPIPRKLRRRLDMVMSSDSEDEPINKKNSPVPSITDDMLPSCCPASQDCSSPLNDPLCLKADDIDEDHYLCSETAGGGHVNETCKSVNTSSVPESSCVPETEIHGTDLFPEILSGGDACASPQVSVDELFQNVLSVEANGFNPLTQTLITTSAVLGNNQSVFYSSHQEGEGFSHNEHVGNITRRYPVMDECSRIDFNKSKFVEQPELRAAVDSVQESWKQLRLRHSDLRHHVMSEKQGAFQIIDLVHRMSHLFSDSDLLLSFCESQDISETPTFVSEESDSFCWEGQLSQMASIVAQHGFCSFARDIATIGSLVGYESRLDIVSEMLGSATNTVALGKLTRHDMRKSSSSTKEASELSRPGNSPMQEREMKSRLFNIIQHMIPDKSYLSLRGGPFSEYLSSLSCISRSETSRLSKGVDKMKRRRGRIARHYLSSGSLPLDPEDITFLDQSNLPHEDIHRR